MRTTVQSNQPLFRSAAVAARKHDDLGAIVLVRPISFTFLAAFVGVVACGLVAFACLASYTAHVTLRGRIVPEGGVIDIASPQTGTIVEKHVSEGQRVAAGDVLLVLASERLLRSGAALETAIAAELEGRRDSLVAQIANTRRLEVTEHSALRAQRATLAAETASLAEAVAAKRLRLALAERVTQRYADLHTRGFLADEQWAMREAELHEQRSGVENLERERAALDRFAAEIDERIETLQPRYANAIAELERVLASSELEIVENDARRAAIVTAPQPGTVTGLVADVGQPAPLGTVLARIVPSEAVLVAELLAPSRAVGFVAAGDEVRLRYAAFPYQKFGHSRGTVVAVSATTVAGGDSTRDGEPLYRVAVALASQTVTAYGAPRRLLPGMAVEADVLLERRRLFEWVLEPLYALAERVR
jgi:membrane fusion protein